MLMITAVLSALTLDRRDYAKQLNIVHAEKKRMEHIAEYIDATMEHCDVERYFFFGTHDIQVIGFTEHSPMGPVFFQAQRMHFFRETNPFFRESMMQSLHDAQFIVMKPSQWGEIDTHNEKYRDEVLAYVDQNFSENQWDCAEEAPEMAGDHVFLFRDKDVVNATTGL
jgi:hypothetical protein